MGLLHHVLDALAMAGSMAWQIAWSLILGFTLSAVVQAVVRRESVVAVLGDDRPASLARATGLGVASSSCSYAAVALARSLFRKGASFTAAIVFEIASTNLVIELGIIMALLMGWQFTLAEVVGGVLMIVLIALFFRLLIDDDLIGTAREQAERGVAGSMEGHAAMDMAVGGEASWWRRLLSHDGYTAVSHIYVMEWAAVIRDIVGGLLVAGAVAAWVPDSFWRGLFATGHPTLAAFLGPLLGPVIAVLSFVCSIGNVPLAAVLYRGGISFGGVSSFMFADLIIVPILLIYRKYYGGRTTRRLLGILYAAMVLAGYLVEGIFQLVRLVPAHASVDIAEQGVSWNYTTILNIVAALSTAALLVRFTRSGGREMLAMMGGGPDDMAGHHGEERESASGEG